MAYCFAIYDAHLTCHFKNCDLLRCVASYRTYNLSTTQLDFHSFCLLKVIAGITSHEELSVVNLTFLSFTS